MAGKEKDTETTTGRLQNRMLAVVALAMAGVGAFAILRGPLRLGAAKAEMTMWSAPGGVVDGEAIDGAALLFQKDRGTEAEGRLNGDGTPATMAMEIEVELPIKDVISGGAAEAADVARRCLRAVAHGQAICQKSSVWTDYEG